VIFSLEEWFICKEINPACTGLSGKIVSTSSIPADGTEHLRNYRSHLVVTHFIVIHTVEMGGNRIGSLNSGADFFVCFCFCLVPGKFNKLNDIFKFFPHSDHVLIFIVFAYIFNTFLVCLILVDCPEDANKKSQSQNDQKRGVKGGS